MDNKFTPIHALAALEFLIPTRIADKRLRVLQTDGFEEYPAVSVNTNLFTHVLSLKDSHPVCFALRVFVVGACCRMSNLLYGVLEVLTRSDEIQC